MVHELPLTEYEPNMPRPADAHTSRKKYDLDERGPETLTAVLLDELVLMLVLSTS